MVRAARVTYDELRDDLIAPYDATEARNTEEVGWRVKHLNRAFRGTQPAISPVPQLRTILSTGKSRAPSTGPSTVR